MDARIKPLLLVPKLTAMAQVKSEQYLVSCRAVVTTAWTTSTNALVASAPGQSAPNEHPVLDFAIASQGIEASWFRYFTSRDNVAPGTIYT